VPFKKRETFILDGYQKTGVEFHLRHGYSMNADVPGLGKTRQAIGSILVLEVKTVVVAPAYLIETWTQELSNTELVFQEWTPEKEILEKTEVLLMSYHSMQVFTALGLWQVYGGDFLIVDESHAFKTPDAARTMALGDLVSHWRPSSFLQLTGTPLKNGNGAELYIPMVFKAMRPGGDKSFFEKFPSYYTFASHFANVRPDGKTFGVKNETELGIMLLGFMIRRDEEDVGVVLPPEVFNSVYVKYKEDPMLLKIFNAFQKDHAMEIQLKMEAAAIKAPFSAKFIVNKYEEIDAPIIAYSDHRAAVEIMRDEMKLKNVGVIMGGMLKKSRDKTVAQFRKGELSVLLATVGGIKEGLNLVESNNMVENDIPWIESDLIQIRRRIRRRGQTKTCFYHKILGCSVDKKINDMVEYKAAQTRKVL
jgi:hypothetical protein